MDNKKSKTSRDHRVQQLTPQKIKTLIYRRSRSRYRKSVAAVLSLTAALLMGLVASVILFWGNVNIDNQGLLKGPALPAAMSSEINILMKARPADDFYFRLPAKDNLTPYMNLSEVDDNFSKVVESSSFISNMTTTNKAVMNDLLAKKGYTLAEDQNPGSGDFRVVKDGKLFSLQLRAVNLASNYATDFDGSQSKFAEVSLKRNGDASISAINIKYAVAFVLLRNLVPRSIGLNYTYDFSFKPPTAFENPYNLLPFLDNLLYLPLKGAISTSWQKSLGENMFDYFYQYRKGVTKNNSSPIFVNSGASSPSVFYDNRIINPTTDLNKNIFALQPAHKNRYNYTNGVLKRLIGYFSSTPSSYQPLTFANVGTEPKPNDQYSGFVPGEDRTNNQAFWGSSITKFSGNITISFANTPIQTVNFAYENLPYANSKKQVNPPDLRLKQVATNILASAPVGGLPPESVFTNAETATTNLLNNWISSDKWLKMNADAGQITISVKNFNRDAIRVTETAGDEIIYYNLTLSVSIQFKTFNSPIELSGSAERVFQKNSSNVAAPVQSHKQLLLIHN